MENNNSLKTILMIGNGFDLYHNLPTRYTDFLAFTEIWDMFYENYIEEYKKEKKNKKTFKFYYDEDGAITLDSFKDFIENACTLEYEKIQELNEIVPNNVWIKYYKTMGFSKNGWIDFEEEMEKALMNIEYFFSEVICNLQGKAIVSIMTDQNIQKSFSAITSAAGYTLSLHGFLDGNTKAEWAYGTKKEELLKLLKNELDNLIRALKLYMEVFVEKIEIENVSPDIKELDSNSIEVINFNYTNTLQRVYGIKPAQIHFIHGSLAIDNMVLGVNDLSLKKIDYVYFYKFFQRIQKRTGNTYKRWIHKENEGQWLQKRVVIMGHSLGDTDKLMLSEVFNNEEVVKEILILYHEQKAYENLVIALIKMFGRDFMIEQTAKERIIFKLLD